MKKRNLFIIPLLGIFALTSCNNKTIDNTSSTTKTVDNTLSITTKTVITDTNEKYKIEKEELGSLIILNHDLVQAVEKITINDKDYGTIESEISIKKSGNNLQLDVKNDGETITQYGVVSGDKLRTFAENAGTYTESSFELFVIDESIYLRDDFYDSLVFNDAKKSYTLKNYKVTVENEEYTYNGEFKFENQKPVFYSTVCNSTIYEYSFTTNLSYENIEVVLPNGVKELL